MSEGKNFPSGEDIRQLSKAETDTRNALSERDKVFTYREEADLQNAVLKWGSEPLTRDFVVGFIGGYDADDAEKLIAYFLARGKVIQHLHSTPS
jgi:hypothetical protein